jgi:predicted lipoprotein
MSTLTDKLPKLPAVTDVLDLDEAKKPAFAAAGVVDLTVEQLKELPADLKKAQATLTAKLEELRAERTAAVKALPTTVKGLPAKATEFRTEALATVKALPAQVSTLPAQAKELRVELTARVEKAQTSANETYAKLAVRGEKLVTQIRRQPTTEAAIAEGKAAVKKAESAATSAKKSTKAAEKAVVDAAEKLG